MSDSLNSPTLLNGAPPVCFILTANRDRARHFYSDVLGLPETGADDFAVSYDLGGTLMRLTSVDSHIAHPHTVLGWAVTDIEAVIDDLVKRDIAFAIFDGFGQDARGIWTAPDRSVKLAWFHDPDGNSLMLTQRG